MIDVKSYWEEIKMDTSKLENLVAEQSELRDKLYNTLMSQISNNMADLKELSLTFTNDLVREDGSVICTDAFKIILFKTNLIDSHSVDVYLDTTSGKVLYDYFDPDINDYLPQEITPEQLKILLSVNNNFENAMFATDPSKIIEASADLLIEQNNDLKSKLQ